MTDTNTQWSPKGKGGGLYQDADGTFWARPWIHGRRTWRTLKAVKEREARHELATTKWEHAGDTFASLAQVWLDAGCPNARLEPRHGRAMEDAKTIVPNLIKYFGNLPAADIRLANIPGYARWRMKQCKKGRGERTVDLDLATLSAILTYGQATGQLEHNPIRSGRPRYRRSHEIRHSREVAPPDAETLHLLADHLFEDLRSETLGWQLLFGAMTGCRTSELLRLRLDAETPDDAGYVESNSQLSTPNSQLPTGHLFLGRRSKKGVNPWVLIGPELREMLDCFQRWHKTRFPKSPWYFPGRGGHGMLSGGALAHALRRACQDLQLAHVTPHGLRSFYVTKRRSDGVTDTVIAGEIGDQTVTLMQTTYGARPANWTGGDPLSWLPKHRLPAWLRWQPESNKIIKVA